MDMQASQVEACNDLSGKRLYVSTHGLHPRRMFEVLRVDASDVRVCLYGELDSRACLLGSFGKSAATAEHVDHVHLVFTIAADLSGRVNGRGHKGG